MEIDNCHNDTLSIIGVANTGFLCDVSSEQVCASS